MALEDFSGNWITDIELNTNKDNFFVADNMSDFFTRLDKKNPDGLLVVHQNIRSLRKYWDEWNIQIKENLELIDVIILTEIAITKEESVIQLRGIYGYIL